MKLASVQVLRFAAAALVISTHAVDIAVAATGQPPAIVPGTLADAGCAGVDLFFVISGFIIASGLIRGDAPPSPTRFYARRWLRVAPLYFLLSLPWIPGQVDAHGPDPAVMLATFLFWPAAADPLVSPYLSVGWTLCFEMLFYAATATALGARRWRFWWMLPLGAFLAAFTARGLFGGPILQFLGNPIILEFLMGATVAAVWRRTAASGPFVGATALALSGLGFAYAFLADPTPVSELTDALSGAHTLKRVLLWGAPSVLLVFGALQFEEQIRRRRLLAPAVFLGDASYSLYLVHPLVLYLLLAPARASDLPATAVFLGGGALSILAGAALYRLLEVPLQAALRQITERPRTAVPTASPPAGAAHFR